MKIGILGIAVLLTGILFADSFEVKTGEGYRVPTTNVEGSFRSRHESRFPYVCYDKRVKAVIDGQIYLMYKGCMRYNRSCKSLGRAHFGKYPNDFEASKALNRCHNARPRFVD